MSGTLLQPGRSAAALALAIAAASMVPAAIAFGWYDDPLFADAETSIEGFGIAASFMGAVALGVAVSAVRVKRRGHSHSWVASSAIAVSVVAIVTGLILPVSLLCHFKNSGPC